MLTRKYKEDKYYVTLKSIYLGYRYKWYDVTSNTVPVPYFSKNEISTHEYKLTYKQWRKIIVCYFKEVFNYLYEGGTFVFPQALGTLTLTKTKTLGVNKRQTKLENKVVYFKNLHTYGYKPRIVWGKRGSWFTYGSFYKFNFTKNAWICLMERLKKDGSDILKLNDK